MTPTIRALIVDDEKDARNGIEQLLLQCRQDVEVVAKAENAQNALEIIIDAKPDIVFLDIQMPVKSGFWLAEKLSKYHLPITVIFVTAYDEYAIQAVKYAAFDLLLKPIDMDLLEETLQRFLDSGHSNKLQIQLDQLSQFLKLEKIGVNTTKGFSVLALTNIIYCQEENELTHIFLSNGLCETAEDPLNKLLQKLPEKTFIKITSKVIINTEYIESFDAKSMRLILSDVLQQYEFKTTPKGANKLLNLEI